MRVAVFHNLLSGGAKRALYGFVQCLNQRGHTVDAYLPDTAEERYLPLAGVTQRCEIFSFRRTLIGSLLSTVRYVPPITVSLADLETTHRRIAAAIDANKYDVVLVEQDQFVMSPFVLRFLTTPTVYYCQQPFRLDGGVPPTAQNRDAQGVRKLWVKYFRNRVMPAIDRQNARCASSILANSYFSRDMIAAAYGRDACVCYLGVDVDVFHPLGLPREHFVLSVGSVTPNKGYDFLLRSLGLVDARNRPRLMLIANFVDPEWKRYLEQLASRHRVQLGIRTLVSETELVLQYNRAALFLYAPHLEPFGLAPLEAMACGTPVVAVAEGGVRESVRDGRGGVLTDRDEQQFAAVMSGLLNDDVQRTALGASGVDTVRESWTLTGAGERIAQHLQRASETPPSGNSSYLHSTPTSS
ncbi:MAG TPA: glycosyltransferase family 4 protein [Gemmatimonadales bacterium]|nr:glycosyltransferase family 4 protein [Gemmatimonadales bacterium]